MSDSELDLTPDGPDAKKRKVDTNQIVNDKISCPTPAKDRWSTDSENEEENAQVKKKDKTSQVTAAVSSTNQTVTQQSQTRGAGSVINNTTGIGNVTRTFSNKSITGTTAHHQNINEGFTLPLSLSQRGSQAQRESRTSSINSQNSNSQLGCYEDRYQLQQCVGAGAYGQVWRATNRLTGETVACKHTKTVADPMDQSISISFLREVQILRRLGSHPSFVKLIEIAESNGNSMGQTQQNGSSKTQDVGTSPGSPVIVMEFCSASLQQLLQSETHILKMANIKYLMRQILKGVEYMHSLGILHRDLATKNILFNISGEIKVCDFGISRIGFGWGREETQQNTKQFNGTFGRSNNNIDKTNNDPNKSSDSNSNSTSKYTKLLPAQNLEPPNMIVSLFYRAIELLIREKRYTPALDVWGIGCILGEIIIAKGGVSRNPFFAPIDSLTGQWEPEKIRQAFMASSEQSTVQIILSMLGKPSTKFQQDGSGGGGSGGSKVQDAWSKRFYELINTNCKHFENFDLSRYIEHTHYFDEKECLKQHFKKPECQQITKQLFVKESFYSLLAELLRLNPSKRITAKEALKHQFMVEDPQPVWDTKQFAIVGDDVARAAKIAEKQRREKEKQLEQFKQHHEGGGGGGGQQGAEQTGGSSSTKTSNQTQQNVKSSSGTAKPNTVAGSSTSTGTQQQSNVNASTSTGIPAKGSSTSSNTVTGTTKAGSGQGSIPGKATVTKVDPNKDRPLPEGWARVWSKSRQIYFYHHAKKNVQQWEFPKQRNSEWLSRFHLMENEAFIIVIDNGKTFTSNFKRIDQESKYEKSSMK